MPFAQPEPLRRELAQALPERPFALRFWDGSELALRAFDDRSHQFRFVLATAPGSNVKITQDDIDKILQTIQPVPFVDR